MRQFQRIEPLTAVSAYDKVERELCRHREFDAAVAAALGLQTIVKPEVSIMLELFEAHRLRRSLTVSMLGLLDGIAPSTALRYIDLLESNGALTRRNHESDSRMRYVDITEVARREIDQAIRSIEIIASASYMPSA